MNAKLVIQNWSQPKPGCFNRRFGDALAGVFDLLGELDDKNCVFARQAHQYDKSDLGENVIVHVPQPDAGDGAEEAHRHNQDNGQWQTPAFVLRGECEENEQHAERKMNTMVLPARIS